MFKLLCSKSKCIVDFLSTWKRGPETSRVLKSSGEELDTLFDHASVYRLFPFNTMRELPWVFPFKIQPPSYFWPLSLCSGTRTKTMGSPAAPLTSTSIPTWAISSSSASPNSSPAELLQLILKHVCSHSLKAALSGWRSQQCSHWEIPGYFPVSYLQP